MVVMMDGKGRSLQNAAGRSGTERSDAAIYVGGRDSRPALPVALSWLDLRQIASPNSAAFWAGKAARLS